MDEGKRTSCGLSGESDARESRIARRLSNTYRTLARISANNTASHRLHIEIRQLIRDVGEVLEGGAICSVSEFDREQSGASSRIQSASAVLNRGASPAVDAASRERSTATSLREELGRLFEGGAVKADENARAEPKGDLGSSRLLPGAESIFDNSDFFDEAADISDPRRVSEPTIATTEESAQNQGFEL